MASYVFTFVSSAASSDLSTFKEIELEPSLGGYAQANSGHQAIDISVTSSATGTAHTMQLAWADGTTAATQSLGVTKIDTLTVTPGSRRTDVGGGSGGYVCAVSAASSSSSLVKTVGVGDVIDTRVTPSTVLPKRRLFIGFTAQGDTPATVTVVVTPTKII